MYKLTTALTIIAFMFITTCGCSDTDKPAEISAHGHGHEHGHTHDHPDRPESLQAAVDSIQTINVEIRDAIQSGNIDEAHELLHEMKHLVDELPDVAADTDLTEQDWKEIQKASEQLSEAFGKLDESFHVEDSDPQAVYDGVAESIDSAVEQISQRIPADADVPATGNSSSEHDHGQDEPNEASPEEHSDGSDT